MSTRGAIARVKDVEPLRFSGRYVHWDCYPTGLGASLWEAYHGHFEKDLDCMLEYLLDDHPAGWSSLCGVDFSLAAGFRELHHQQPQDASAEAAPHCYCHGDRNEPAQEITEGNASGCGCEWVYAFCDAPPPFTTTWKGSGIGGGQLLPVRSPQGSAAAAIGLAGSCQSSGRGHRSFVGLSRSVSTEARLLPPTLLAGLGNSPLMLVLSSFTAGGDKMIGMFGFGDPDANWRIVGAYNLHGPEPDWQQVEEQGRSKQQQVPLTNEPMLAVSLN